MAAGVPVRELRLRLRPARDRPARGERPARRARVDRRHVRGAAPARHRRRPAAAGWAPGALDSAAEWDADVLAGRWVGDLRGARSRAGPAGRGTPPCRRRPRRNRPRRRRTTRRASRPRRPGTPRSRWRSRPRQAATDEWLVVPPHETRTPVVVLPMAARHRFLAGARGGRRAVVPLAARPGRERLARAPGAGRRAGLRPAPRADVDGRDRALARRPDDARVGAGPGLHGRGGVLGGGRRRAAGGADPQPVRPAAPARLGDRDHLGRRPRRPDAAADGRADRARVHVPGRRRLHLGGRPRPGVEPGPPRPAGRRCSGTATTRESSGQARFVSRDELRYSFRSIHLFAPWVRKIHLVTAGQVPELARPVDHPQVAVVDHSAILPADALPTFNSHAIESALHRLPDLAEHFVYLNDDFFLGRPLGPGGVLQPGRAGRGVVLPQHHRARRDARRRAVPQGGVEQPPAAPGRLRRGGHRQPRARAVPAPPLGARGDRAPLPRRRSRHRALAVPLRHRPVDC